MIFGAFAFLEQGGWLNAENEAHSQQLHGSTVSQRGQCNGATILHKYVGFVRNDQPVSTFDWVKRERLRRLCDYFVTNFWKSGLK